MQLRQCPRCCCGERFFFALVCQLVVAGIVDEKRSEKEQDDKRRTEWRKSWRRIKIAIKEAASEKNTIEIPKTWFKLQIFSRSTFSSLLILSLLGDAVSWWVCVWEDDEAFLQFLYLEDSGRPAIAEEKES